MISERTSVSLPPGLVAAAEKRFGAHYVTSFSAYIAALIRRDVQTHEAAQDQMRLLEKASSYMPPETPRGHLANVKKRKTKRKAALPRN